MASQTQITISMWKTRKNSLQKIAPGVGRKFKYEYDFGDSWEHTVKVEAILEPEEGMTYPVCVKGKRACPPEDVGGVWAAGEAEPSAIQTAKGAEMFEWVGNDLQPEESDLEQVNSRLQSRM